jgi:hypothetical protein
MCGINPGRLALKGLFIAENVVSTKSLPTRVYPSSVLSLMAPFHSRRCIEPQIIQEGLEKMPLLIGGLLAMQPKEVCGGGGQRSVGINFMTAG